MSINTEGSLIAAFSFIAFVLLVPPFVYHHKQRNIPACSLIFWLCYENLVGFINAVIWSGENFASGTSAPGYCDVTVRISSGAPSGKLASIATVMFNLFMIIRAKNDKFLNPKSKRRIITNIAMCWITPLFVISTSIIVQATRYVIFRYRGCVAPYTYSFLTLILTRLWDLVWSFIALVFAVMTLVTYLQKRRDISDILTCTGSGLNQRRFARLVIFSLLVIFVLVPLAVYNFVNAADTYSVSTFNLSEVHNEYWSMVYFFDYGMSQLASPICNICLAFVAFLIFGLGTDALAMYRRFLGSLGIKKFSNAAFDDIPVISSEFSESKQASRGTAQTEATIVLGHEMEALKRFVFQEDEENLESPHTLAKDSCIGKTYILESSRSSTTDIEDQRSDDTGINFEYHVVPK